VEIRLLISGLYCLLPGNTSLGSIARFGAAECDKWRENSADIIKLQWPLGGGGWPWEYSGAGVGSVWCVQRTTRLLISLSKAWSVRKESVVSGRRQLEGEHWWLS